MTKLFEDIVPNNKDRFYTVKGMDINRLTDLITQYWGKAPTITGNKITVDGQEIGSTAGSTATLTYRMTDNGTELPKVAGNTPTQTEGWVIRINGKDKFISEDYGKVIDTVWELSKTLREHDIEIHETKIWRVGPKQLNEVYKHTPDGYRVFVNEKKGPCWKGYEQYGMKEKNGKQVPNCVPKKKKKKKIKESGWKPHQDVSDHKDPDDTIMHMAHRAMKKLDEMAPLLGLGARLVGSALLKGALSDNDEEVQEGWIDDPSPGVRETILKDKINSIKNLISYYARKGMKAKVQALADEIHKLQMELQGEALNEGIYNNDQITADFIEHYKDDLGAAYNAAKNSYLDIISTAKNHSKAAAELNKEHSSMDKQKFQDSVMEHFGVHLAKYNFPQPNTAEWKKAEDDYLRTLIG